MIYRAVDKLKRSRYLYCELYSARGPTLGWWTFSYASFQAFLSLTSFLILKTRWYHLWPLLPPSSLFHYKLILVITQNWTAMFFYGKLNNGQRNKLTYCLIALVGCASFLMWMLIVTDRNGIRTRLRRWVALNLLRWPSLWNTHIST